MFTIGLCMALIGVFVECIGETKRSHKMMVVGYTLLTICNVFLWYDIIKHFSI